MKFFQRIATHSNGSFRLTEHLVTPPYTDETAVGKNVLPILEDSKGAGWIGTSEGLSVLRDGKFTDYRSEFQGSIPSLNKARAGETLGLSIEKINSYPGVYDFYQDKNGVMWFAANSGLYSYDGTKMTRLTTADGLPGNDVKVFFESRDGQTMRIGTYGRTGFNQ